MLPFATRPNIRIYYQDFGEPLYQPKLRPTSAVGLPLELYREAFWRRRRQLETATRGPGPDKDAFRIVGLQLALALDQRKLGRGTPISAFEILDIIKVVDLTLEICLGNPSLQEFSTGDIEAELKSVIQGHDTFPPTHAHQETDCFQIEF